MVLFVQLLNVDFYWIYDGFFNNLNNLDWGQVYINLFIFGNQVAYENFIDEFVGLNWLNLW